MSYPLSRIQQRIPLLRELPIEVTALSLIAFFVALGFGIVAPVIPMFASEFGVSALAASSVISVFAFTRLIAAPPAGAMVNRIGERRVLSWGLIIVSVSSALAGLSQNFTQLLILRGLGGFGSTMFTVAAMALLIRIVPAELRGRAASAWSGGFLIGGLAGPAVGGIFVALSLRSPFFIYAITLLAASAVSWKHLSQAHLLENANESTESALKISAALRSPAYLSALGTNFNVGLVRFGVLNALIPLMVIQLLDLSPAVASIAFLVSSISQASLLVYAGRLTDSHGRRISMILGNSFTVVGLAVLAFTQSPLVLILAMILMGLAGSFLSSAPTAVVGDVTHGQKSGRVVSTYQMAADFGAIFGPLLAGFLLDSSGSFSVPFALAAGFTLIFVVMSFRMPETKR
jgi:MFS transporter, DHA1 family, multidrug resistance protein